MIIGFLVNYERDPQGEYAHCLRDFLIKRNVTSTIINLHEMHQTNLKALTICVTLGGDGTMLCVAPYAARYGFSLLGINLGNVGYLTDVQKSDGLRALSAVLDGHYTVQKRLMLQYNNISVLNDIVFKSDGLALRHFTLYHNREVLTAFRADGVVFATPSGTTAYNASAGGPLLLPESRMFAITPICPHGGNVPSWVLDASTSVSVTVDKKTNIYFDGGKMQQLLRAGETAVIKRSDYYVSTIKTGS